jgi:protein tyrosine phosphatase (PTP) superfamily phosphohydrolase (DUF442 family)
MNIVRSMRKGLRILVDRFRTQGVRTTLLWMYARGIPKLTGVPNARYSRITPALYVGPQYSKRGLAYLRRLGISGGINMRVEFDDSAHGLALAEYCHLPTVDDDAPTLEDLNRGVEFIQRIVKQDGKVYIHCAGGIGRAPTMAVAYLVSEGLSLDEAVGLVRKARPFIDIRPTQMEQLRRFAASLSVENAQGESRAPATGSAQLP